MAFAAFAAHQLKNNARIMAYKVVDVKQAKKLGSIMSVETYMVTKIS
jgi:ribosomal protein L10